MTLGTAALLLVVISGWMIRTVNHRADSGDRKDPGYGEEIQAEGSGEDLVSKEDPSAEGNRREEARFADLAQQFSYDHNRITTLEKIEDEDGETAYVPIVGFHGRQPGEVEAFSMACCDLVESLQEEVGFQEIGYFPEEDRCYFDLSPYLEPYDRTTLYNAIYHRMEQDSLELWRRIEKREESADDAASSEGSGEAGEKTAGEEEMSAGTEEMPAVWKDYEADCFYQKKDGTQLRMVGVDRAAGSSYYALLEAVDGVNTSVINTDPYLGNGGYAKWIDFLEDEKTGFSCLAYSGGSLGSLYRTEDGGRSFHRVTYPSAEAKLPDGSLYNPFIMPEKVWEEEGRVYLLAGQGPDGDYYEDGVRVCGLYESEDLGKNWRYVESVEDDEFF